MPPLPAVTDSLPLYDCASLVARTGGDAMSFRGGDHVRAMSLTGGDHPPRFARAHTHTLC